MRIYALLVTLFLINACASETHEDLRSGSSSEESANDQHSDDSALLNSLTAYDAKSVDSSPAPVTKLNHVWQFGPGGGGRMEGPAIYPHDPNILFLASDMRVVARSHNRGKSWSVLDMRMINSIKARFRPGFGFGPKPSDQIYVTTRNGLLRSNDKGLTWTPVPGPWTTSHGIMEGPDFITMGPEKSGFALIGFSEVLDPKTNVEIRPPLLYFTFSANGEPRYVNGKLINGDGAVEWIPMIAPKVEVDGNSVSCRNFLTALIPSPGKFESWHVMIACREGIFFSANGGQAWELRNKGLPSEGVQLIDAAYGFVGQSNANRRSQLYALTNCSPRICKSPVYVSTNQGLDWRMSGSDGLDIGNELSYERVYQQIATSTFHGLTIYLVQKETHVSIIRQKTRSEMIDPNEEGRAQIFASSDGGKTWRSVMHRHPAQVHPYRYNIVQSGWRSIGDWGWRQNPDGIHVNPFQPHDVFVGELLAKVTMTPNGAQWQWETIDTPGFIKNSQGNSLRTPRGGFPVMGALDFAFHPNNPNIQLIGMEDFAGWRTLDNARTWEYTPQKRRLDGTYQTFSGAYGPTNIDAIAVEPGDTFAEGGTCPENSRIWIAGGDNHNLPQWSQFPTTINEGPEIVKLSKPGYLGFSRDCGKTWNQVGKEKLPFRYQMTSVAIDSADPAKFRIGVAVAGRDSNDEERGRGFYWSSGVNFDSWTKDNAWMRLERGKWVTYDNMPGIPYKLGRDKLSSRYFALTTIFPKGGAYSPGDLYIKKSQNELWTPIGSPKQFPYPVGVTFDPIDPNTIYIAAFSTPTELNKGFSARGGVWATRDNGVSWLRLGDKRMEESVFDIAVHPKNNRCLVASVLGKGLFVSYDRGEKWLLVDNFPPDSPYRLVWDPRAHVPNRLVVTTFGQGLWSLSVPCVSLKK